MVLIASSALAQDSWQARDSYEEVTHDDGPLGPYRENVYGPGIGSDAFGRPGTRQAR